jgi:adenylate cyclase
MSASDSSGRAAPAWWQMPSIWWTGLARSHPFVALFLVIIWPNALWSVANLLYNQKLIVATYCDAPQTAAFEGIAVPLYTGLSWVVGMGICVWLTRPVRVYWRALKEGREPDAQLKRAAQRRLINLPWYQLLCNFALWMPGGLFFPSMIYILGGGHNGWRIAVQFLASFAVSAVVTTFQTYVLLDRFLLVYLYPTVFTSDRPVQVQGGILLPFQVRLWFLWGAVSLGPIVVLVLITVNLMFNPGEALLPLTIGVVVFSIATGGIIFWVVGADISSWLDSHVAATRAIGDENFDVRIAELRSDEWGRLTDSFNTMAETLSRGRQVHETFGQFVGPEVRDEILKRYGQLGGNVQEITVMFADIRGFTRRSSGTGPEEVVELLNRFLSQGVQAVEGHGGWVNKFLGDGFMALFGTPLPREDHADLAVAAARDLLRRLGGLNRDLEAQGQVPLKVGIGIHTGPALVGCIGASVPLADGRVRMRLEFTAIGETVNLTQRLEELTKTCGAAVILSEATRSRLRQPPRLCCVGPQEIRGGKEPLVVYGFGDE